MGLLDKKAKTPEQKLVEELVGLGYRTDGKLKELNLGSDGNNIKNAVKKAEKKGLNVEKIKKIFEEELEKSYYIIDRKTHESQKELDKVKEVDNLTIGQSEKKGKK